MYPGREVSPWNSSTGICHDLSWPSSPVTSDVQVQLNSLVYVHNGEQGSSRATAGGGGEGCDDGAAKEGAGEDEDEVEE